MVLQVYRQGAGDAPPAGCSSCRLQLLLSCLLMESSTRTCFSDNVLQASDGLQYKVSDLSNTTFHEIQDQPNALLHSK